MKVIPIQLILVIIASFVFIRTLIRWKKKELDTVSFVLWSLFWFGVIAVVLYPRTASFMANILGVGRGADVIIYFAVALLFYLIFRIFIKLYKIEKDITTIVRSIALAEKQKDKTDKTDN